LKIEVRVKAGARQTAVEKKADGIFAVKVKARAKEGEANQAVIEALADYFDIPKTAVQILRGHKSCNKLIEIQNA